MNNMEKIRLALQEKNKGRESGGGNFGGGDNAVFPFWNIPDKTSATLRFLPDKDESNLFFWRERQMIHIEFPGIKGEDETRKVTVKVPCLDMWADLKGKDPIIQATKPWWDEPELKDMARKYWKKYSYVFQGFVVSNPLKEEQTPENPIRRFIVNKSIFKIIEESLMSGKIKHAPTDFDNGRDFIISKTRNGEYANYFTSNWDLEGPRPLTEAELEAIEKHGLHDLGEYLPTKPTPEHIDAIAEMFEASVNEELYDPERWAKFYRPAGLKYNGGDAGTSAPAASTATASAAPAPAAAASDEVDEAPAPAASSGAADALAKLRAKASSAAPAPAEAEDDGGEDGDEPNAQAILDIIRKRSAK